MNAKIIEKPITSNRKVYIINNSEKMTVDAQNCLLKTLEEPPTYVSIILVCSKEEQLLTTIKSRCTKISFHELSNNEIKEYIQKQTGEQISENILELAEGSISKALKIKDKEEIYENIKNIVEKIETTPKSKIWKIGDILYKNTEDIFEILDYMNILFFRKVRENSNYLECINIVEKTKRTLKTNGNYNMTIDNLLIQIWEEINEKYNRS